jgi:hypothetical protein
MQALRRGLPANGRITTDSSRARQGVRWAQLATLSTPVRKETTAGESKGKASKPTSYGADWKRAFPSRRKTPRHQPVVNNGRDHRDGGCVAHNTRRAGIRGRRSERFEEGRPENASALVCR